MVAVTCPHCAEQLGLETAPENGQTIHCLSCRKTFAFGAGIISARPSRQSWLIPLLLGLVVCFAISTGVILMLYYSQSNLPVVVKKKDENRNKPQPIPEVKLTEKQPKLPKPKPKEKDLDPQNKPEPAQKKPQPKQIVGQLSNSVLNKVKNATVFIRVNTVGSQASGSGFFAFRDGIILTNAHVLGMLHKNADRPNRVQVILNHGQQDEEALPATILSVDRSSDLAVLKVSAGKQPLPKPLQVQPARGMVETQRVYIFGFPFGSSLGKNVTVTDSTVSSFRSDSRGILTRIQVNGGMHPGNSGGPVVNPNGDVVGVAVSGILGTQINFAIAGDRVRSFLGGRITRFDIHQSILKEGRTVLPVTAKTLDPLGECQGIDVLWWTAEPEDPKNANPPGNAKTVQLKYNAKANLASGEFEIPTNISVDHVFWHQVIFKSKSGKTHTEPCAYREVLRPIRPQPVTLTLHDIKQPAPLTLQVKLGYTGANINGESVREYVNRLDAKILIKRGSDKSDPSVQLSLAGLNLFETEKGKEIPARKLNRVVIEQSRSLRFHGERTDSGDLVKLKLTGPTGDNLDRNALNIFAEDFVQSLQIGLISIPRQAIEPGYSWPSSRTLPIENVDPRDGFPLELQYTYLGLRQEKGRDVAVIDITGKVRWPYSGIDPLLSTVKGSAKVDLTTGLLLHNEITVNLQVRKLTPSGWKHLGHGEMNLLLSRDYSGVDPYHPLRGAWQVALQKEDGKDVPLPKSGERWFAFGPHNLDKMSDKYRVFDRTRYWLRPDIGPDAVDVEFFDDANGSIIIRPAIFRVKGRQLQLCAGTMGQPRPTDYDSFTGSGRSFYRFLRVDDFKPPQPKIAKGPNKILDPGNVKPKNPPTVKKTPLRTPLPGEVWHLPKPDTEIGMYTLDPKLHLIMATRDKTSDVEIRAWDGKNVTTLNTVLLSSISNVRLIAVTPDCQSIICSGYTIKGRSSKYRGGGIPFQVLDRKQGKRINSLYRTEGTLSALAVAPDSKTVLTGGPSGAFLWKLPESRSLKKIRTARSSVQSIAFSPDSSTAAITSGGRIFLVDAENSKQLFSLPGNGDLCFSANGNELYCISDKKTTVWDVKKGVQLRTLDEMKGKKFSFSSDGNYAVGLTIRGWAMFAVSTGQKLYDIPNAVAITISAKGRHILIRNAEGFTLCALPNHLFTAAK